MRLAAAAFAILALLAPDARAAAYRLVTLNVPRAAAAANEDVVLRVHAGVLRRGAEIDVYDGHGVLLGTISPFGLHAGQEAGIYTIPLQLGHERPIAVRLVLTQPGAAPRGPTAREVRSVTLAFVGVTR